MRVLVTGAAGFIGSALVRDLGASHEVLAVTRHPPAFSAPGIEWIEQDLARLGDARALPAQVDVVCHLAQSRRYREFPLGAPDVFDVNVESTFRLLEYARRARARAFVYASTGSVYGTGARPFRESDPVSPAGFYASSKRAAELLIGPYQALFSTTILRLFTPYGPGQEGMLVPNLLQKVLTGEPIVVHGDPGPSFTPIFITDVLRVFQAVFTSRTIEAAIYNVAGAETVSLKDLVTLMGSLVGRPTSLEHKPVAASADCLGDNTRMRESLGVEPSVALRDGLASVLRRLEAGRDRENTA